MRLLRLACLSLWLVGFGIIPEHARADDTVAFLCQNSSGDILSLVVNRSTATVRTGGTGAMSFGWVSFTATEDAITWHAVTFVSTALLNFRVRFQYLLDRTTLTLQLTGAEGPDSLYANYSDTFVCQMARKQF